MSILTIKLTLDKQVRLRKAILTQQYLSSSTCHKAGACVHVYEQCLENRLLVGPEPPAANANKELLFPLALLFRHRYIHVCEARNIKMCLLYGMSSMSSCPMPAHPAIWYRFQNKSPTLQTKAVQRFSER